MADLKKVWLDAGHDDIGDVGAVGYEVERELTVKVTDYQYEHLKDNYECELKKSSGKDSLSERIRKANEWGADFVSSNHFNSAAKKEVGDGYEALIYDERNDDIAECFEKHVKAAGQNIRPRKYRKDLAILRDTNAKAVLNEIAFVNTKADIKDWNDNSELKKMGVALAEAIADQLNLPKKSKSSKSGTTKKVSSKSKSSKKESAKKTFIKAVQKACGAKVDGVAGTETLGKTVTVSATYNRTHKVVKAIQTYLNALGYNCGKVDGIAGDKFTAAVKKYQKAKGCVVDGEITAGAKTWKKLLGLA